MTFLSIARSLFSYIRRDAGHIIIAIALLVCMNLCAEGAVAQASSSTAADVLVLSNGDTLHGKLVKVADEKVTFHSEALGDVSLGWNKIKELRTAGTYAVLEKNAKVRGRNNPAQIPTGALDIANSAITLRSETAPAAAPIPVDNAVYIVDAPTLEKQLHHQPGFTSGWNGAATAGAAIVAATENQYTFSGGIGLVRAVPTVSWLTPRNRTSLDFTGSFGKITQPGYRDPTTGIVIPAVVVKSAIYHADAEGDQYISPRMFALAQVEFDHNFAQDLDLQQIYGGGLGLTFLKTPRQEADVKATLQYEKQQFISDPAANQNLIGSTFAASYVLHHKLVTYTQSVAFIPAYNNMHAYSANETNTLVFPAYKGFSFSTGTLDSYLNNPPLSLPPTKRNSFQFTMGVTYGIKSRY